MFFSPRLLAPRLRLSAQRHLVRASPAALASVPGPTSAVAATGAIGLRPPASLSRSFTSRSPVHRPEPAPSIPPSQCRPPGCPAPRPLPLPRSPIVEQLRMRRLFSGTPKPRYHDPNDPRLRHARPLFTREQAMRRLRAPSTKAVVVACVGGALVFYFSNIETVPVSGRRRFNCYSEESVQVASDMQYKQLMDELQRHGGAFLSSWDRRSRMVKRVMERLIPVSGMDNVEWEVHVIDDRNNANAFVLPGGKVFVFSGIFDFARNEDALAAVLGHEIAHNLAQHVAERMSQGIGSNMLYYAIILLASTIPGAIFAAQFFGGRLITTLFDSPMSRKQESEADYIGLMMMSEACYDPQEAVGFWTRMDQKQRDQPPEWMSTHPSHQHRIENIQGWMSKAMDKRAESDCHGTQGFAEMFKRALRRGEIIAV